MATGVARGQHLPYSVNTALTNCQKTAYSTSDTALSFDNWVEEQCEESDMWFYWNMIMKFQKLYLMFVKSQISADWHLNVATQMQLIKYVFAFDRTNYSRWMTVSVHKDQQMPEVHPEVFKEFEDGRFVLQKIISYYYYDLKSPNVPYTRVLVLKSTTSTIH